METLTAPPPAPTPAAKPAQSAPLTSVPPSLAFPPPSTAAAPKADTSENPWDSVDNDVKPRSVEDAPKPAPKTPEPPKSPEVKPAPKPPEKPVVAQPARPGEEGVKQLRAERERLQGEVTAASTKTADLQARLDAATARGQDTEALSQRLAAAEKERDDAKKELSFARYEPNDSVKAARKNLNQTGATAKEMIESLEMTNSDGQIVPASWKEFQALTFNLAPGAALKLIRQQFGENAQLAVHQYFELKKAEKALDSAESEDRAGFNERVTRETATRTQHREGFGRMVEKVRQDMASKNTAFAHSPDDADADAIFKKGLAISREATADSFNSKSPEQKAILIANMEMRAADQPRARFLLNRATLEIERLKAENAELRGGTAPPEARPGGTDHSAGPLSAMDDLEQDSKGWEAR